MAQQDKRYLISLPERLIRSLLGLTAGITKEVSDVVLPNAVRRTQLYRNVVDTTLRFVIHEVGGVDAQQAEAGKQLPPNVVVRRAVGDAIDAIGIITFHASPVWVLSALADVSGAGRQLIPEIADELKKQRLLEPDATFSTVNQLLDGLERTSSRAAATLSMPPLDVTSLRAEWAAIRQEAASLKPSSLPRPEALFAAWRYLNETAQQQGTSVFATSSMMALSAVGAVPQQALWLSASARAGAARTGRLMASALLEHYQQTLQEIRKTGYGVYATRQLRPYVTAAVAQFSPERRTLTDRMLERFSSLWSR